MPIIKNIGKRDRMVADRILRPGDAKYITPKQAEQFVGIPDFEIVDETPVKSSEKLSVISPVQAKVEVATPIALAGTSPKSDKAGFRGRKAKAKKEKKNGR